MSSVCRNDIVYPGNNAYFKDDGLCYTENDILVYKLYITNIPKNMSNREIKNYFFQYGEVSSINIEVKTHRDQSKSITGYVNYKNANSAAKALMYNDGTILIKPADSWLQPILREQYENHSSSKERNESKETEENLILKLNDDCLLHIFSFLSLKEQIKLSTLCESFKGIFEMKFRKNKSLHISDSPESLTLMELRELIRQCGDYIEKVQLEHAGDIYYPFKKINYSHFMQYIIRSCINLRSLKISRIFDICIDIYANLSINLKYLTKLELISCEITDQMCKYLCHLPMLDYLDLTGNCDLRGKYLSSFLKLTHLNLNGCMNIVPKYFSDFCKKGLLKSLHIRSCVQLSKNNFEEIESNLDDLVNVVIGTNYRTVNFFHIARLKNLTRLSIFSNNEMIKDKLFEELATFKGNTLQELILNSIELNKVKKECICSMKGLKKIRLFKITIDGEFFRRIANLPNLIELSLASCNPVALQGISSVFNKLNNFLQLDISYCKNININALHYICDKIMESKQIIPCTLHVFEREITKCVFKNDKYFEILPPLWIKY